MRCFRALQKKGQGFPRCSACSLILHFECASIASQTWKSLSKASKTQWICIDCEKKNGSRTQPSVFDKEVHCARCHDQLNLYHKDSLPRCAECRAIFHFNCGSIPPKTYSNLPNKSAWKCVDCRYHTSLSVGKQKVTRPRSPTSTETSPAADNKKQRTASTIPEFPLDQSGIMSPITTDTGATTASEQPPLTLNAIADMFEQKVNALTRAFQSEMALMRQDYTHQIQTVDVRVTELEQKVRDLTEALARHDVHTRKNCITISGVPLVQGEKLHETLDRILVGLGYQISIEEINNYHWLPSRNPEKHPVFLISFVSRLRKFDFMAKTIVKKPTAQLFNGDPAVKIFINDQLSSEQAKLLSKAKTRLKNTDYRARVFAGKIYYKNIKNQNSKSVILKSLDQLKDIPPAINPVAMDTGPNARISNTTHR